MNMTLLHDITFYILYGAAALAAFVVVERAIFFAHSLRRARRSLAALGSGDKQAAMAGTSLPEQLLRELEEGRHSLASHQELEDLGQAIYIDLRGKLVRSLWMLEAVVAGAPLLGLLGTILGIIDTFKALAEAGVSDPGQVSRGIGTALYATGLGIAIALVGMVCNSHLQDRLEHITDHLKMLLLRAGLGTRFEAPKSVQASRYQPT